MSEKIIETLMQLFALIAKPQQNDAERRGVVESFLSHHLNQDLVNKYLSAYSRPTPKHRRGLKKALLNGVKGLSP